MSYYTIIEDLALKEILEEETYDNGTTFADWPLVVALLYFFLGSVVALLYARAKDNENDMLLK